MAGTRFVYRSVPGFLEFHLLKGPEAEDHTLYSSFLEFHLLKGPEAEDHTLYSSHTMWQSKQAFEAWTKSEEFRTAHARAGNETTGPLYLEHPKFEGLEWCQFIIRVETRFEFVQCKSRAKIFAVLLK